MIHHTVRVRTNIAPPIDPTDFCNTIRGKADSRVTSLKPPLMTDSVEKLGNTGNPKKVKSLRDDAGLRLKQSQLLFGGYSLESNAASWSHASSIRNRAYGPEKLRSSLPAEFFNRIDPSRT